MAHPDQPAIIMASSGETVTFGEFEARSNRVAHLLRDAGLRRGDHVAVFIENSPQLLEIEGGAERVGLYYSLIHTYRGAVPGDGVGEGHVRVPRGHDVPQPGPAVPLGAAGERVGGAAPRLHGHRA